MSGMSVRVELDVSAGAQPTRRSVGAQHAVLDDERAVVGEGGAEHLHRRLAVVRMDAVHEIGVRDGRLATHPEQAVKLWRPRHRVRCEVGFPTADLRHRLYLVERDLEALAQDGVAYRGHEEFGVERVLGEQVDLPRVHGRDTEPVVGKVGEHHERDSGNPSRDRLDDDQALGLCAAYEHHRAIGRCALEVGERLGRGERAGHL